MSTKLNEFPSFLRRPCNSIENTGPNQGMSGFVFEGADGSQLVMWSAQAGGETAPHSHDYDEYCIVLEGTFTGMIGGKAVTLTAGDECVIPAGVVHGGTISANYRSIDGFGGRRVTRATPAT